MDCYLGVEEDLRTQEPFVAHVDVESGFTDSVDSSVLFDPFTRVRVILCELLHDVWTDVTVPLLHTNTSNTHKGRHTLHTKKPEIL